MKIGFIGHGYVGLVTAAVFADLGNTVYVAGRTPAKIEKLKKGISPFYEPGLDEMVKRNVTAGRLIFTLDIKEAIKPAKIVFICVGTPPKETGEADLSSVFKVAEDIGKVLDHYAVIVTKSTVPVGTNRKVAEILRKNLKPGVNFDIASCPEFLREGTAISDTTSPDRIVMGTDSPKALELLLDLHKPIPGHRITSTIETAEMIKYASNSLLATKISFANAMSFLCDAVHADVEAVLDGMGMDRRLGRQFLSPGVGFGGSCFPKDVKALVAIAKEHGYDFELLKAVNQINHYAKKKFVDTIDKKLDGVKGKTIGIWGLAFKANTDDMREASSIDIINGLLEKGAKIKAFDPIATETAKKVLPAKVQFCSSPLDAAENVDALALITEWNEFKQIDLSEVKKVMKGNYLFDGRNIYDPEKVKALGFNYKGIGRE